MCSSRLSVLRLHAVGFADSFADFKMMFSSGFSEGNGHTAADHPQSSQAAQDAEMEDAEISSLASDDEPMEWDSMDDEDDVEDNDNGPSSGSKRPDSTNTGDEDEDEDEDGDKPGHTAHTSIIHRGDEEEEVYLVAEEDRLDGLNGPDEGERLVDANEPATFAALSYSSPTRLQRAGLKAGRTRAPASLATTTMRSASTMLHSGALMPEAGKTLARQSSALSALSVESGNAAANNEASISEATRPSHTRKPTRSPTSRNESTGRKYIEIIITDAT